jgi:peptidoglycan hydrolase-like amidase
MLLIFAALSLQAAITEAMRGVDGVVLLADVASGKLLAAHDIRRARTRHVAPGSTLKPIALVELIDEGAAHHRIACTGRLRIAGRTLDCGHPSLASPMDGEAAVGYSCNEWFARVGQRIDPERFGERLREWGFETTPAATEDERALQAIGEYGVRITPSGLLGAYRRLARSVVAPEYAAVLRGMEGAVDHGSAQLAKVPGLAVAGKTGTTPNASRTDTHAWFAGFAPARQPRVAVVVFLERGRGGPSAAPIGGKVLSAWQTSLAGSRSEPRPADPRLLTIGLRDGRIRRMSMEDYVLAVLAGESASFPPEALKAMAVAARTYATANRRRHAAQGWDFCDTSHCQNLRFDRPGARIASAVEATQGILLWHAGKPAQSFYHRHCGGETEAVEAVWPGIRAAYLRQQQDTFCLGAGKAPWQVEVSGRRVAIAGRTGSGRVAKLLVDGRALSVESVMAELRLVSARFELRQAGDRVVFEGYGAGHGVGLCQTGAAERARQGHTWRQILAFYFPGTKTGVTAQGLDWTLRSGERIEMWTTQPSQDGELLAAAERLLREAEVRTGIRYDGRARLRVFPTVGAFRDATGEPGWVAASARSRDVRLQPASVLRSRGLLESTLLHEMLHLVVEQRARPGLPEWYREGLVLWIADRDKPASSGEGSIESARSEGEFRQAYDAARSRVKRLVERYGREVVLSWAARGLPAEVH